MATINLLIVVNTAPLLTEVDAQGTTHLRPAICARIWAYMITDHHHCVWGNGTADLHMRAAPGDVIRITGVSLSNQLDHAIFIYDFQHQDGDNVLDTAGMKNRTIARLSATPTPDQAHHVPPGITFQNGNFYVAQIDVNGPGTEHFNAKFLIYGPPDGNTRPILGHFQWNPSIRAS